MTIVVTMKIKFRSSIRGSPNRYRDEGLTSGNPGRLDGRRRDVGAVVPKVDAVKLRPQH